MGNNKKIDWSSPDALYQIIDQINQPLDSIIKLNESGGPMNAEIVFKSSNQIKKLLDEIAVLADKKMVNLHFKSQPDIFSIYEENDYVKSICSKNLNKENITKSDETFLLNLEREVYESISENELNLYDLSYKLAISERQLYRKTKCLVFLTPNKYIRILKLHKAKKMIDNYFCNSVSQIAYAVGFSDVYYFSKIFSEQYGKSPKEMLSAYYMS